MTAFEQTHKEMVATVKNLSEKDYNSTIQVPVGPKEMGDWRRADTPWFEMMDQVNHRGQLSVYLRMAGGKAPSIYGFSAEEPRN